MKSAIVSCFVLVATIAGQATAQVCVSGQVLNNVTAAATETATFTFGNWNTAGGNIATIAGLTLNCSAQSTSAGLAATFYRTGALPNPNCTSSGSLTGWTTSGTGNSVIFTSTTPNSNVADITYSTNLAGTNIGTPTIVQGSSGTSALSALLTGSKVCGRPAAGYPGGGASSPDRWQEQHRAGNQLWDYKMGPGHNVDPEEQVGTYGFDGTGTASVVTHTYGSTTYRWRVFLISGTTYSFCTDAATPVEVVRGFVTPGATGGCGGSYPAYP